MKKFILYKDASGALKVKFEGDETEYSVTPIRYFPSTAPNQYVGLFRVNSDGMIGEEVVTISSYDEVDESSLKVLEEELSKASPEVWLQKSFSVTQAKNGLICYSYREGKKLTFQIRDPNDITMIRANLVVVRSIKGEKFFINPANLDRKSKTVLDCYL